MNKFCVDLDVDIPVLASSVDLEKFQQRQHTLVAIADINPTLISWLKKHNINIAYPESFYQPVRLRTFIHSDGAYIGDTHCHGDYVKLNWVFGGQQSRMNWFDILPDAELTSHRKSKASTDLRSYQEHELKLAHTQAIGNPSIVQVGVPHNIYNPLEPRLCISIPIVHDNANNQRVTFDQACVIFKDYIIDQR